MAMDTDREKEIGLGPKWPYFPLKDGECMASTTFSQEYEVNEGDVIYFRLTIHKFLQTLIAKYNIVA